MANGDIFLDGVRMGDKLVDIFTKSLDEAKFYNLRNELSVLDLSKFSMK